MMDTEPFTLKSPRWVTVDIYGHLTPGANREAVDRLDDFEGIDYPVGRIKTPYPGLTEGNLRE